jgi:hypothetical protein
MKFDSFLYQSFVLIDEVESEEPGPYQVEVESDEPGPSRKIQWNHLILYGL